MYLVRRALGSQFFRHNLVFFSGSFAVSVLNYLYYPIIGRLLAPADFGEVQTIISFFLQFAVFLQVLGLVSVGITNTYDDTDVRDRLIQAFSRLSFQIALTICVVIALASIWLKGYFQFASALPFVALAVSLLISVPGAFANAFLQARKRFGALARSSLIGSGGKLIISTALVYIGFKTSGAIAGIVLAQTLALVYALRAGRGGLGALRSDISFAKPDLKFMRPELRYAGLIFAASLTINLLFSLDVVVVKHLFSPTQAGLYAGISTIARIIFFLTGPLAIVLIPSIKPAATKENRQYLVRSMTLLLVLGGSSLVLFAVLPRLVITILLGHRYLTYASLLPKLSLAIFILSIGNLLVYYCVAARYYSAAIIAPICLLLGILLVMKFHASISAIITDLLVAGIVLAVTLTLRVLKPDRAAA